MLFVIGLFGHAATFTCSEDRQTVVLIDADTRVTKTAGPHECYFEGSTVLGAIHNDGVRCWAVYTSITDGAANTYRLGLTGHVYCRTAPGRFEQRATRSLGMKTWTAIDEMSAEAHGGPIRMQGRFTAMTIEGDTVRVAGSPWKWQQAR